MPNKRRLPPFATICQLALAGYVVALLTGTHLPPTTPFLPSEHFDKLYHFTAYLILAGLLATTWQFAGGDLTPRQLRWAWIAVAVFAALDEITQIPVHRDCSFWDWTADAVGAAIGLLLFVWLRRMVLARVTANRE